MSVRQSRVFFFVAFCAVVAGPDWSQPCASEVRADAANETSADVSTEAEADAEVLATLDVDPDDPSAGHSYHGEAFNEGPRQKAYLMGGTGKVHFPISTGDATVQAFFDQGIGQLHGFWYFEAERSFRQAAAIDPDCAMNYWGMALANVNNRKRARGFIEEALERREDASEHERMWIDALAESLIVDDSSEDGDSEVEVSKVDLPKIEPDPAGTDSIEASTQQKQQDATTAGNVGESDGKRNSRDKARKAAYRDRLEAIIKAYPDDIEAKAFLALQLWRDKETDSRDYTEALLQQVLAVEPMHPSLHFRIHLWDLKKPERALDSAAICGQAAPSIAHMWHMPGHIYSRLHRYADAAWQQEASARVDHAHMIRDRVMPDEIHNFAHNNEWLIRNLINVGRVHDAVDLAKNMIELPRHPRYNTLAKRGSTSYGRQRLFDVLRKYELWDDLLALSETMYLEPTDVYGEQVKRWRMIGVARFGRGDVEAGEKQIELLKGQLERQRTAERVAVKRAEAKLVRDAAAGADSADISDKKREKIRKEAAKPVAAKIRSLENAIAELEGHVALAAGDYKSAVARFEKAEGLPKEDLSRAHLAAGDTLKAMKFAREAVSKGPGEVVPLANLVEVAYRCGKTEQARNAFDELREISAFAELEVPIFQRIAPIAAEFGHPGDWRVPHSPREDIGVRPDLDTLGPFRWHPYRAQDWTLFDAKNRSTSLSSYRGKPVIVIFYLGYGCLHCVEQLQAFAPRLQDFMDRGIEVVAVSTDSVEKLQQSLEFFNEEGKFPIPLVSDANLDVFKAYRAYDDFEEMTLHGTFLVDPEGFVLWQDIGYEPFSDVDFVLEESERLLSLRREITKPLAAKVD